MERTEWLTTYQNVRRDILLSLTDIPNLHSQKVGLFIGQVDDAEWWSPAADESCIRHIVDIVDKVFDRCEETVQHTAGQSSVGYKAPVHSRHIRFLFD